MGELEITRGDVVLSAEEAGEGTPVVLLHGLTATRRYVVMGSRALERSGHRVVLFDARGHGRSSPAPGPDEYGYEELAADLLAVLDARGIDRAVLAGASMGAHTIAAFALRHPDRVAAACFITPAFDPRTHEQDRDLDRWDALAAGLRDGGIEGFVAAYGEPDVPEAWRENVLTVIRQRLAGHAHLDAVADALQAVPRSRPFDSLDDLRAFAFPAVVVASRDEADPGHPLRVGEAWADSIPGARVATEEPGASPLAWQGSRLSKLIAALAQERPAR